jgi:type IV pilus assembly protein PilA
MVIFMVINHVIQPIDVHERIMTMKKQEQGATLTESMLVLAILTIVAAFAIPNDQNYVQRAYVAEGLSLATPAKAAMSEYASMNGSLPASIGFGDSNTNFGLPSAADIQGTAVESIRIDGNLIRITYNDKVRNELANMSGQPRSSVKPELILEMAAVERTPNEYKISAGSIQWYCGYQAPTAAKFMTIPREYLPDTCR